MRLHLSVLGTAAAGIIMYVASDYCTKQAHAYMYTCTDCDSDILIFSAVIVPEHCSQSAGHHLYSVGLGVSSAWCQ